MGTLSHEAVGEWFETEAGPLTLYARQWLDASMAEDVVQESFLRLMRQNLETEHVKGWLYRVVRNLALNRVRSSGRRQRREEAVGAEAPGWFDPDPYSQIDGRAAEEIVRGLPADQREVVTLRIWGGLTFEEIAGVLDVSAATALRKHSEALKRIRVQMEVPCLTKIH